MSQKYRIEFEIDGGALFDAVVKVGQKTAGERLLMTFMQASTGRLALLDHVALAMYGITAGEVQKAEPTLAEQEHSPK